ncbi:hypothetical protein [Chryseobacterium sp. PMSZPI]|uniref:hypothetical protein n=1 Tax=Chryseobacterium sp. PMSZPI TaxID=1033900 RepID=UPI000C335B6F|nr:hypothetical protein [Chryseobacterium sp. PMSZPI]PKF75795.1 hypothetical protein CW752_01745 [Chryseobacterium sp. PMSZPI]
MNVKEKEKIEKLVKNQLAQFITLKRLTKKNNRLVSPTSFLRKLTLAKEFASKYTHQNYNSKDDKIYFNNEVSKACKVIIDHYL